MSMIVEEGGVNPEHVTHGWFLCQRKFELVQAGIVRDVHYFYCQAGVSVFALILKSLPFCKAQWLFQLFV